MVILDFCLLCPSFCPLELRHFILVETGPFFSLPEEGKEVRRDERRIGEERESRERERMK